MSTDPTPRQQDPTADYRKYAKGPNFGLIVALACITMLVLFVAALFLLHGDGRNLLPGGRHPNPATQLRLDTPLQSA